MKLYSKLIAAGVSVAMLASVACKKADNSSNKPEANTAEIAMMKQIALGFYKSLPKSDNGLKTNVSQGKGPLTNAVTRNTKIGCGDATPSTINKTIVNGDTTRTIIGNQIFTTMCNGYYSNNYNIDAYTLLDTTTTNDKGAAFDNTYKVTLWYDVRTLNSAYSLISIQGETSTSDHKFKINNGQRTEYHLMDTKYKLVGITAQNGLNPLYISGKAEFSTTTSDMDATTGPAGVKNAYSGFMEFLPNNTIRANFLKKDGGYKVYLVNPATGEVSEWK